MEYAIAFAVFWMVSRHIRGDNRCAARWAAAVVFGLLLSMQWVLTRPEVLNFWTISHWFFEPLIGFFQWGWEWKYDRADTLALYELWDWIHH